MDARPDAPDPAPLRSLRERIDQQLGRLVASDPSGEPEMVRLVDAFHRAVAEHLDHELQRGVLCQAVDHQPHLAGRVAELVREQAAIRRAVDVLCEDVPGPAWSDFEVRFHAFCEMLAAHLQAENEVLLVAYLDDLGGHH